MSREPRADAGALERLIEALARKAVAEHLERRPQRSDDAAAPRPLLFRHLPSNTQI